MCGRFFVGGDFRDKLNELLKTAGIVPADNSYSAAGQDVFPSNDSIVICRDRGRITAVTMPWGYTNPYRKGLIINARAETVREKKLFSDGIENHRCVIPSSGFYEWDPYKARFRFTRPDGGLLLLAGFYHDEQGAPRYTILTTEANDSMKPVHDRMPVMLESREVELWINDNSKLPEFLSRPQPLLASEQDSGQIRMIF